MILLWLDDFRIPQNFTHLFAVPTHMRDVHWVKDHEEFVAWITENGLPDAINFDHDLHDEHYGVELGAWLEYTAAELGVRPTGRDSAAWLASYCREKGLQVPTYKVHSQNPAAKQLIDKELANV